MNSMLKFGTGVPSIITTPETWASSDPDPQPTLAVAKARSAAHPCNLILLVILIILVKDPPVCATVECGEHVDEINAVCDESN